MMTEFIDSYGEHFFRFFLWRVVHFPLFGIMEGETIEPSVFVCDFFESLQKDDPTYFEV
jgi:hypothetical protein